MAGVPGVLLDQVHEDVAHRHGRRPSGTTASSDTGPARHSSAARTSRRQVDQASSTTAWSATAPLKSWSRSVAEPVEPRYVALLEDPLEPVVLDLREVPHEPEQGHRGRRDRAPRELFGVEPAALQLEGQPVAAQVVPHRVELADRLRTGLAGILVRVHPPVREGSLAHRHSVGEARDPAQPGAQTRPGLLGLRPVAVAGLAGRELLGRPEAGSHRRVRAGEVLVVVDAEQPDPALLAEGQRDAVAQLDQLRLGEVRVQPGPERVEVALAPGDGLGVGSAAFCRSS